MKRQQSTGGTAARVPFALSVLAVVAAPTPAACGGHGGSASGGQTGGGSQGASQQAPAGSITVTKVEFKITPGTITARAGQILFVENKDTVPHDLVVQDASQKTVAKTDLIQSGSSGQLRLGNVPAGSYTAFCDVPGRRAQGMVATLTVQ